MKNLTDIINSLPDKFDYKNTTSRKFKLDLVDFFKGKNLSTCLEIGTNHGHTTLILSYLFDHVYTVELQDSNIEEAKLVTQGRSNITYIKGDAYNRETFNQIPSVDTAFIDCMHTHPHVLFDIQTSLNLSSTNGLYIIFDDYAHPISTGVYTAIEQAVQEGLTREQYIGEDAGYIFRLDSPPLVRKEGIILSYGK